MRYSPKFVLALAGLFVAGSAALTACSGVDSTKIKNHIGGGGGGGDQASEQKTLPTLDHDDLKLRALEELMRSYRSLGYLVAMPSGPDQKIDCMQFKHYSQGPALRIYYDCSWTQRMGGDELLWAFGGNETLDYRTDVSAISDMTIAAARPAVGGAQAKMIFKSPYHRATRLTGTGGTRSIDSTMTIGNVGDLDGDFWQLTMKGELNTLTIPMRVSLNTFNFVYRAADPASKHPITKTIAIVPRGPISFDGSVSCHRPIGVFDWTILKGEQVVDKGTFSTDQNGMTETTVTPQKTVAWPASCLEFPH